MRKPAPAIGLRLGHRVTDNSPFLYGIVGTDLEIPAGSRVSLRRIRPDGSDLPTHVIVIAPPHVGVSDTPKQLRQAQLDSAWMRPEPTINDSERI